MIGLGLSIPQVAVRGGGSAPALALDNVTSAVLAFSIKRKLRTAYTGKLIRVRESGGDTEDDFGADANGDLDTAALESFCGANNGFITKVYEQSGHASAVDYAQATAALQPQIVASGVVITKDGNVAMQQPTSGAGAEFITLTSWATRPAAAVAIEVWSAPAARDLFALSTDVGTAFALICEDGSSSTLLATGSGGSVTWDKNGSLVLTNGSNTRDQADAQFNTDTLNIVRHNALSLSSSAYANLRTEPSSFGAYSGPEYWSEQIIITDTGDVAALESNIATAYGITLA